MLHFASLFLLGLFSLAATATPGGGSRGGVQQEGGSEIQVRSIHVSASGEILVRTLTESDDIWEYSINLQVFLEVARGTGGQITTAFPRCTCHPKMPPMKIITNHSAGTSNYKAAKKRHDKKVEAELETHDYPQQG